MPICGPTTYELGLALAALPTAATDSPHALIPKFFELSRTVATSARAVRVFVKTRTAEERE